MTSQELAAAITAKGLRPTQQRIAVYDYLLQHPIHPSADTIYTSISATYPTFSRTTIYNSLYALARAGLIRTINIDAEEQRFDGNPRDHGHFRCRVCGEIFDFDVDEDSMRLQHPAGFSVESQDLFLTGLCPGCVYRPGTSCVSSN